MTHSFRIYRASPESAAAEALADILLDCVDGGASVGFMHPLPRPKAVDFWKNVLASAARGERIVLAAPRCFTENLRAERFERLKNGQLARESEVGHSPNPKLNQARHIRVEELEIAYLTHSVSIVASRGEPSSLANLVRKALR